MSDFDEPSLDDSPFDWEDTVEFRRPRVAVRIGTATHAGRRRETNQDHYLVVRRSRSREVIATNMPTDSLHFRDDYAYFIVVADGIGGRDFGDVASRLVLETGVETATRLSSWVMNLNDVDVEEMRRRVAAYVDALAAAFRSHPLAAEGKVRMGTTWTCGYVMNQDVLVAHVGDSRAYVLRDGVLEQLTTDHTLAQELVQSGVDEREANQYRNTLTNFLGTEANDVRFDLYHTRLDIGDRLLLCTDGLTDEVDDDVVAAELRAASDPQRTADQLVARALANGGRDNVTVVVAAIEREN